MLVGFPRQGECAEGIQSFRSPEMLHVWLIDHPAGRFSPMMHLDDDTLQRLIKQKAAKQKAAKQLP
jgi:hypothetical protein